MNATLLDLLRRAGTWPDHAQRELATIADEIEAELGEGDYVPTTEELESIDRGLKDVSAGKFIGSGAVAAVFKRHSEP